jgi:hypothetical protein
LIGWVLDDGATYMAIGFVGGIGAAAMALAPRRQGSA